MLMKRNNSNLCTMNDFVQDFFGNNLFFESDFNFPKMKSKETENEYCLTMAIPGYKKEDINLSINDDVLTISSQVEKDDFKQSFENSYTLPEDVNIDNINASMENGILSIKIEKIKELPKTSMRKIDIK